MAMKLWKAEQSWLDSNPYTQENEQSVRDYAAKNNWSSDKLNTVIGGWHLNSAGKGTAATGSTSTPSQISATRNNAILTGTDPTPTAVTGKVPVLTDKQQWDYLDKNPMLNPENYRNQFYYDDNGNKTALAKRIEDKYGMTLEDGFNNWETTHDYWDQIGADAEVQRLKYLNKDLPDPKDNILGDIGISFADDVRSARENPQPIGPLTPPGGSGMPGGPQFGNTPVPADGLVANQMNRLLDVNNDYMKRAILRGQQFANKRGLLNSSLAGQAGQAAAIDAAMNIAVPDAATHNDYALQDARNRADYFLQDARLEAQRRLQQEDNAAQRLLQADRFQQQVDVNQDEFAQERAVEIWKQENIAFAQLLKGMSDVQATDIDAKDKQAAIDQLWDTYKASRPLGTSLRDVRIVNGEIVGA